jgi:predicted dehydrogenase
MASVLKAPGIECVGIADISADALSDAGALAPGARAVESLDELLREEPDGIVIATPSALHAAQAVRALEAGAAVFCQKPLGRTAGEVQKVIEAARRNDRLLWVDLSYREVEGMRRIRSLIRSGELGTMYAADLVFHNAYGPDKPWFYDPPRSGGGCVLDLGIHLIDLLLWTLDYPGVRSVSSRLIANGVPLQNPDLQVEDFAHILIDLENGVTGAVSCSWNLPAGQEAVIEAAFYGTRGGARLRNVNGSFYDFEALHLSSTTSRVLAGPPDDWGSGAITRWVRALARDRRYSPEIERVQETARIMDEVCQR